MWRDHPSVKETRQQKEQWGWGLEALGEWGWTKFDEEVVGNIGDIHKMEGV